MKQIFISSIVGFLIILGIISCQDRVDYSPDIALLKSQVAALKKTTDSLNNALKVTNGQLSTTNARIDDLTSKISLINSQILVLTNDLTKVNANISLIISKLEDLQKQIDDLRKLINDLSTGLMGFYPFNGNANDESGNGNNGKIADAILTTDRFGNSDKAYSFNGTSSRIVTTKIPDLRGKITMAAWFNTQSLASWGTIIDCRTSTSAGVGIEHNNKVSFTTSIGGSYSLFYSNYTIPTNTWIHVATVFNGSQKLIYINGELDKSQSYSTPLLVTTEPFVLGDRGVIPSGAGNYFKGKLDDIRFYNTALTAEQIKFLYNINQ